MPTSNPVQNSTRRTGLAARRQLAREYREIASGRIVETIRTEHWFVTARSIALYCPMPDEVDVSGLTEVAAARNCRVFLPIVKRNMTLGFGEIGDETRYQRNRYGIREPVVARAAQISAQQLSVVVTPLSAFDDSGNRVGMGGGYYDRTFAFRRHRRAWLRPRLIGVAFDAQRVPLISANSWDVKCDAIVTEYAIYEGETLSGKPSA